MADTKISALTAATTPLDGTEVLPIVQSGVTKKAANNDLRPKQIQSNATNGVLQIVGPSVAATRVMTTPDANFTVARIDAAQSFTGDQTLSTGNLVIGTSGKGIDFSVTGQAGGMTSELLNDYEEGTWTPSFTSPSCGFTVSYAQGYYTKIGRLVYAQFELLVQATSGTYTNQLTVAGLPFNTNSGSFSYNSLTVGYTSFAVFPIGIAGINTTTIDLTQQNGTAITPTSANMVVGSKYLIGSIVYNAA